MWEVFVPRNPNYCEGADKHWNRCEVCGKFISYDDFESGSAVHHMTQPDWEYGAEKWETLCKEHNSKEKPC